MPKVALYNMSGKQTGEIDLNDWVFGCEVNASVLHQAVTMQLNNQRQGNAQTKTRANVRGGGRKPWKQKGTGRARAGTIRSPLWVGGGVVFGPHPRKYTISMPRKVRRLALRSALTSKVNAGELLVLEDLNFSEIKTKNMIQFLEGFKAGGAKALVVMAEKNEVVSKSAGNIPGVTTITSLGINVYDLLNHPRVFVTRDAIAKIEEVLA
jgi:large subunit ribosomal protein L4